MLTTLKEDEWGQRSIRFYDPDKHIIDVGESMKVVIKRFLLSGVSVSGRLPLMPAGGSSHEGLLCFQS